MTHLGKKFNTKASNANTKVFKGNKLTEQTKGVPEEKNSTLTVGEKGQLKARAQEARQVFWRGFSGA